MALNVEVFKVRATSAVFFAIVMLAGLLINNWTFLLLISIIHCGCYYEYLKLQQLVYNYTFNWKEFAGFILMGLGVIAAFANKSFVIAGYPLSANFFLPLSVAGFMLLIVGIIQHKNISTKAIGAAAAGLLYISLTIGLLLLLRQRGMIFKANNLFFDGGRAFPLLVIAGIWVNDTMAYIVGSQVGRTPLHRVSPKKTWEGTIGGAVLAVVVVSMLGKHLLGIPVWIAAIASALAAVFGTIGDLIESALKRRAGVKDSGNMMPGHGGFLDRFDSLLLATPAVWLFLELADK